MAPDTRDKPNINDYKTIGGLEFIWQRESGYWLHVGEKSGQTQQEAQEERI